MTLEDNIDNEKWDIVLTMLNNNPNILSEIDTNNLAWKIFQYSVAENGKDKLIEPYGQISDLKKLVLFCKTLGLKSHNLIEAVAFDDEIAIENFIVNSEINSEINSEDFGERTSLFIACAKNDFRKVKLLVENNCNVSHFDIDNFEAIDYTISEEIILYLKSVGGKTILERKSEYDEYCEAKEFWNKLNNK